MNGGAYTREVYNWTGKSAPKQAVAVLINQKFCIYWYITKLQNIIINRIPRQKE